MLAEPGRHPRSEDDRPSLAGRVSAKLGSAPATIEIAAATLDDYSDNDWAALRHRARSRSLHLRLGEAETLRLALDLPRTGGHGQGAIRACLSILSPLALDRIDWAARRPGQDRADVWIVRRDRRAALVARCAERGIRVVALLPADASAPPIAIPAGGGQRAAHTAVAAAAIAGSIIMPAARHTSRPAEAIAITRSARSMIVAPAPVQAPLAGPVPRLVGVAGRVPDDAVALVKLGDEPLRSVRIGERVEGWLLASLEPDRAVFTQRSARVVSILPPAP